MKLRNLLLVTLFSFATIATYAQTLETSRPVAKQSTVNVGTPAKPLYFSSESLVQQLTDAATNGGNDLSIAFTYASNGDSEDAALWIVQAQTDFAPILSQSVIPPVKGEPVTK